MEPRNDLKRVARNIQDIVLDFVYERLSTKTPRFYMVELSKYVAQQTGVAPDSPGRILRSLRAAGRVNYKNINRSASLYELYPITTAATAGGIA